MFEFRSENIDPQNNKLLKKEHISLDKDLDCFILVGSNNTNFVDVILRTILDSIIDKVTPENAYKEFSIALENINSFIKTWSYEGATELNTDIIIGILHKDNFMFSSIGNASCYLIKTEKEVLELTSKEEDKKEFSFISTGELKHNEILILGTKRILDYLSQNDIIDGIDERYDITRLSDNIKQIIIQELNGDGIGFISCKYLSDIYNTPGTPLASIEQDTINIFENIKQKIYDTKCVQIILKKGNTLWTKISKSPKRIKNIILVVGMIISLFVIYHLINGVIKVTTVNNAKETAKQNIAQIKTYIKIASENVTNSDAFDLNIKNAQALITKMTAEKIFINDLEKINDDINILKKQFNKVETFDENSKNAIFEDTIDGGVKIIQSNKKLYIINKKGVMGPILPNTKPKSYTFNSLENTEVFVDAGVIGEEIYLLTSYSKIVQFTKNGYFTYMDVSGQKVWEKSKGIISFLQNIYLLSKENNQIFKHTKKGNSFEPATGYLKTEDLTQIGDILSIGTDGSFYILKKDLSILKFYASPVYRLEKIVINQLPQNYDINPSNSEDAVIQIKTRSDLNYFYLLLNNKIWIFKPNTTDYKSTKSLTYIGQIEGNTEKIQDFTVIRDGTINILNKKGIYNVSFEVSDDKLILR